MSAPSPRLRQHDSRCISIKGADYARQFCDCETLWLLDRHERDRLAGEVETLRARLAAVEALANVMEHAARTGLTDHARYFARKWLDHLRAALEVTPDA